MKRILVIHGPNLNLLGDRVPAVYGKISLKAIDDALKKLAKAQGAGIEIFQSNHEGELVSKIGEARKRFDAIVINPAAYTHTSVAIRDAVLAAKLPTVEAHLSNIYAREEFRRQSLIAPVASGQVSGFGAKSYEWGFLAALSLVNGKKGRTR